MEILVALRDSLLVVAASLMGALVGGLITGRYTMRAVSIQHRHEISLARQREKRETIAFLLALHDEIEMTVERYRSAIGNHLEALPEGEPLLAVFPVASDYFLIYDANAPLVGGIRDRRLRQLIVRTYLTAKALVDSYKMNNTLSVRLQQLAHNNRIASDLISLSCVEDARRQLAAYSPELRKLHFKLMELVAELLPLLRDYVERAGEPGVLD